MSDEKPLADKIRIRLEIASAITNAGFISLLASDRIIAAIEQGKIPGLRINYGGGDEH